MDDLRDLNFNVSQIEDQYKDGLLKPAFKKTSPTIIAFVLKECLHHLMVPRQANAMAEMPASPIAST